jgi:hypothetical protein
MLPHGNYPIKSGPLKGWLFYEPYGKAVDEIADYIRANVAPQDSLLIMSDLYLLNAMTGRDSYRGVSYMWPMFFQDAPIGARPETVRQNILEHPPDWILVKREEGKIGDVMAILQHFQFPEDYLKDYGLVQTWGPYGMLKRTRS